VAVMDVVRTQARQKKLVRLRYRKKSGSVVTRTIEPYSEKDGFLFGHSTKKGHTEKFATKRIKRAEAVDKEFKPRWEVEL
jgi:predicted DNA-binding transcriptional regulator YafY